MGAETQKKTPFKLFSIRQKQNKNVIRERMLLKSLHNNTHARAGHKGIELVIDRLSPDTFVVYIPRHVSISLDSIFKIARRY